MVECLFFLVYEGVRRQGPQACKKVANSLQYGLNKLVHNVFLMSLSIVCKEKVEGKAFVYVFYVTFVNMKFILSSKREVR